MISWIVAATRPEDEAALRRHLLPTFDPAEWGDQLIVVRDASSITQAYAQGQARAALPVRVYVHADVEVLDAPTLRDQLIGWSGMNWLDQLGKPGWVALETPGMVGLIGSRDKRMPWWEGEHVGSVIDARLGRLGPGTGGPCAMLDGLLLATRQHVEWDTGAPGWHGYDHDACAQMLDRGLTNWCLTAGHELVRHATAGPTDTRQLAGWDEAVQRFRERWG